jgi:hypothetical protein
MTSTLNYTCAITLSTTTVIVTITTSISCTTTLTTTTSTTTTAVPVTISANTDSSTATITITTSAAIIYGMGATDAVTSALAALDNGTAKSSSTIVTADKVNTVRGSFDQSTGSFTYSATGTDTLVVYDADAIATTASYDAIVLVGVSTVTLGTGTTMAVTFAS